MMVWVIKWLSLISLTVNFCDGFKRQILSGQWYVRNSNKSINVPASVPGGIYSDLMSAGIIRDIYYRFNDIEYRWIAKETWTYSYTFQVDSNFLDKNRINLVFEGLDTFSTIFLNDVQVGSSDNMFIRYVFDIKAHLKSGENSIVVIFKSAIVEALRVFERQSRQYVVPPVCVPGDYHGECHVNHIRKMQASFSWDWGPAFPSVGIWKTLYIEYNNAPTLRDVIVDLKDHHQMWNIHLKVYFETGPLNEISGSLTTELQTDINRVQIFTTVSGTADEIGEYEQNVTFSIPRAHVKLWWPNGFGKQWLYKLTLKFAPDNYQEEILKKIKIGFRTVELVQKPKANGLTFYFKVNNLPIFAKGSNWIPANILPEKGSDINDMRYLLESAAEVHMNMLRVWGGGVYETDELYAACDQLGILIWQDFMFACSMYPVHNAFLQSVKTEIKQQVRRLQHHACVAVWAGNNENEAALRGNWYGTANNFSLYKDDYVKLYVDNIREVCLANDPTRAYLVSSPTNGLQSEKEGYVAKNPYDSHFGDIHYYNYVMDGWDQNIYTKTRFASEYGFQSLPSFRTMAANTNISSDLKMGSEFMESRQHHPLGYDEMKHLMSKHVNLPDVAKEHYLKTYIYYSQISQAMSVKAETEWYRQWRSRGDEEGRGLTMGALYWQLNDVWPAPSWSSIDTTHTWKMLHYYAKHFFAPLLISTNLSPAGILTFFANSDLTTTVYNATLTITYYKWNYLKPVYTENRVIKSILPGYSSILGTVWLDKDMEDKGCGDNPKYNCFVYCEIKDSAGSKIGPDNFVFPAPLKDVNGLTSPNLSVKVESISDEKSNIFNLTISTDTIAPFVWLETDEIRGKFSDNGFLQVTKYKNIQYKSAKPITRSELQSTLTITSLLSNEHL